jgi:hypothetical protein
MRFHPAAPGLVSRRLAILLDQVLLHLMWHFRVMTEVHRKAAFATR